MDPVNTVRSQGDYVMRKKFSSIVESDADKAIRTLLFDSGELTQVDRNELLSEFLKSEETKEVASSE